MSAPENHQLPLEPQLVQLEAGKVGSLKDVYSDPILKKIGTVFRIDLIDVEH